MGFAESAKMQVVNPTCAAGAQQRWKSSIYILYCKKVGTRRAICLLGNSFLFSEEALQQRDKIFRHYLKPDLFIIDDIGLKRLPSMRVSTCSRSARLLSEPVLKLSNPMTR
jgi:hypothetical protein